MQKKIILFGGLFFLISLLVMAVQVGPVQAEEDPCFYVKDCLVPAPTLVVPELNSSTYSDNLVITGLSWNETLVDIYVDGVYNGRAELNLDDSGIANFAYKTFLPLIPGEHSVYTVARNLNERERSVESPEINFSIMEMPAVISKIVVEEEPIVVNEPLDSEETVVDGVDSDNQEGLLGDVDGDKIVGVVDDGDDTDISVAAEEDGEVSVNKGGRIEGGVSEQTKVSISDLQKTVDREQIINEFFSEDSEIFAEQRDTRERQNRQIGLAMLGVIIVISFVWLISSRGEPAKTEKIVVRQKPNIVKPLPKQDKTEDAMDDELDKLV